MATQRFFLLGSTICTAAELVSDALCPPPIKVVVSGFNRMKPAGASIHPARIKGSAVPRDKQQPGGLVVGLAPLQH
jgi:hypothetical protein